MQNKIYLDNKQSEKVQENEEKVDIRYEKDEKYNYTEGDNYFNNNEFNKKVNGASSNRYFCVFRVGKKIKDISQIQTFEKHMQRDMEVPNADPELQKYNRILIGDSNVLKNVKDYIYGIKLRSNANIGMDLVLTGGNGFFNNMLPQEREQWIDENIKFLKDNFGDNCVYACIHFDETTPHIHALIVPKFWNEQKKRYELSSNKYFDGIDKMRNWQDKYANHMNSNFKNLMRGIRGSKAKHMDIKTYYSIINKKLDVMDDKQIVEYAKRNYLIEKRLKSLEFTLCKMNENGDTDKLIKKLDKTEKNNKIYKETIKAITKKYGIKEKEILEIVDKVQGKNNKNEREK